MSWWRGQGSWWGREGVGGKEGCWRNLASRQGVRGEEGVVERLSFGVWKGIRERLRTREIREWKESECSAWSMGKVAREKSPNDNRKRREE